MIKWRLSDEPVKEDEDEDLKIKENRDKVRCTIFLGYTSNMVSCGMREYIKYLC
jgi:deoxyhypusine synthase